MAMAWASEGTSSGTPVILTSAPTGVDVELRPLSRTYVCADRDASTSDAGPRTGEAAELETEPVTDVGRGGGAQVGFGLLVGGVAVDVDVEASAYADVLASRRRAP